MTTWPGIDPCWWQTFLIHMKVYPIFIHQIWKFWYNPLQSPRSGTDLIFLVTLISTAGVGLTLAAREASWSVSMLIIAMSYFLDRASCFLILTFLVRMVERQFGFWRKYQGWSNLDSAGPTAWATKVLSYCLRTGFWGTINVLWGK